MTISDFQKKACRTIVDYDKIEGKVLTAELNLVGEAGEIIEQFNDRDIEGKQLDKDHLIEELGDVLWSCAFICEITGLDLQKVLSEHITMLHTGQPVENIDFKKFSAIVNSDPGYDPSGENSYHENLFIFSCRTSRLLKAVFDDKPFRDLGQEGKDFLKDYYKNTLSSSIGDVVEALSLITHKELGGSLDVIALSNILKLEKRYDPSKKMVRIHSDDQLYQPMKLGFDLCTSSSLCLSKSFMLRHYLSEGCEGADVLTSRLTIKDEVDKTRSIIGNIFNFTNLDKEKKENFFSEVNSIDLANKQGENNRLNSFDKNSELSVDKKEELNLLSGINSIRKMVNHSCKIADCIKKAHYKGTPIDEEKLFLESQSLLESTLITCSELELNNPHLYDDVIEL